MVDEDIEATLERGEIKTRELAEKYQNAGLDDLQRFTSEGVGSSNIWQGEDWTKKASFCANSAAQRADWHELDSACQAREKGQLCR